MKDKQEEINSALISKAVGCTTSEVVEEYAINNEDGNLQLVKKKVTTKKMPPDIAAAKTLLEFYGEGNAYENLTDEELQKEKQRLLKLLQKTEAFCGDIEDNTQDEM